MQEIILTIRISELGLKSSCSASTLESLRCYKFYFYVCFRYYNYFSEKLNFYKYSSHNLQYF